jgi:hypothetical protein
MSTKNGDRIIRAFGPLCILFFILVLLFCMYQCVTTSIPEDSPASSLSPSVAVSAALSPEEPTSASASSDPFMAELDNADTAHVLELLATADGAYTDACYARLADQLLQEPEATLQVLLQNLQGDSEEGRILQSLGKELYYVPQSEAKKQLHTFLSSMDASNAAYDLGRQILDAWDSE